MSVIPTPKGYIEVTVCKGPAKCIGVRCNVRGGGLALIRVGPERPIRFTICGKCFAEALATGPLAASASSTEEAVAADLVRLGFRVDEVRAAHREGRIRRELDKALAVLQRELDARRPRSART